MVEGRIIFYSSRFGGYLRLRAGVVFAPSHFHGLDRTVDETAVRLGSFHDSPSMAALTPDRHVASRHDSNVGAAEVTESVRADSAGDRLPAVVAGIGDVVGADMRPGPRRRPNGSALSLSGAKAGGQIVVCEIPRRADDLSSVTTSATSFCCKSSKKGAEHGTHGDALLDERR
jgi:hypothetical protein